MTNIKDIDLDWDVKFETFKSTQKMKLFLEYKDKLRERYGDFITWYRRSSTGHVTLRLKFENQIDILDHFAIRARLGDDVIRLTLDLKRIFDNGPDEINRTFDWKVIWYGDEVKKFSAGEWELLAF